MALGDATTGAIGATRRATAATTAATSRASDELSGTFSAQVYTQKSPI